jgi:hypothetical protein
LDPGKFGPGTPIDISEQKELWGGHDKTNGFLHKSVDGRIPALKDFWNNMACDVANPIYESNVIPWGNGVWLDVANIDTKARTLYCQKPAKGVFRGIMPFEQGFATGNPVQPYGLPRYSKKDVVLQGLVGYKVSMTAGADGDDYMAYLAGDVSKDIVAVRETYADWMAAWKAAAAGSKLGIFFDDLSGFPIVAVVAAGGSVVTNVLAGTPGSTYDQDDFTQVSIAPGGVPVLTGASFGGFAVVYESENEAAYFSIRSF